mgnify:CR=1 FL=1
MVLSNYHTMIEQQKLVLSHIYADIEQKNNSIDYWENLLCIQPQECQLIYLLNSLYFCKILCTDNHHIRC